MRRLLHSKLLWTSLVLTALGCALSWTLFFSEVQPPKPPVQSPEEVGESYDRLLSLVVDGRGQVDYPRLREERVALDAYLGWVAVAPLDWDDLAEPDLAFLLNAYNAWVLFGVLQNQPARSVGEHKLDFFLRQRYRIAGRWLPLHWLEHRVIRARFNEPRVHFALNCASRGCPPLLNRRYDSERLMEDLSAAEARTLEDRRYARWKGDVLEVSALFEWFAEDFEPTPEGYLRAARPEWPWSDRTRLRNLPWDWSLNQADGSGD